ncbi:uncharacterized protein LOC143444121 [Clavelina lepadiformis]|uniref:uncharacterized protein LOC143444121 n=1 Tax=Clavelina lepadiformis TaxID=159417 RepID=UPI0040437F26
MSTQWMKARMLKQTNLTQVTFSLNVKHLNLLQGWNDCWQKNHKRAFFKISGITVKVVISMLRSKLLTSELATSPNWMEKGHKRGMHSSQLAKAVLDAAENSGIKEAESICEVMK